MQPYNNIYIQPAKFINLKCAIFSYYKMNEFFLNTTETYINFVRNSNFEVCALENFPFIPVLVTAQKDRFSLAFGLCDSGQQSK